MKRKKAALYDPYLDIMGGGERHLLSIMRVLQESGYDIDVFWDVDLSEVIKSTLNLTFNPSLNFIKGWREMNTIGRFQTLGNYDAFLYATDGSYFFSSAKENYVFCMVPQKSLYKMNPVNRLKTLNYTFISNSNYTQQWLEKWGIPSNRIYPYLDDVFLKADIFVPKKPIILTVGRFFRQLHAKRQDIAIEWFKKLKLIHPQFQEYTLVLSGRVQNEDSDYYHQLQQLAENRTDIIFKPNSSFVELLELYGQAQFYWHFTGYQIDSERSPQSVEHLGITPLEAMASGCITCAYKAGGPAELIRHKVNGLLFTREQELFGDMLDLMNEQEEQNGIKQRAKQYVTTNFSYLSFARHVREVIVKP